MVKEHFPFSEYFSEGLFPPPLIPIIEEFYQSYMKAIHQGGYSRAEGNKIFEQLLQLVAQQFKHPYPFEIFHQAIRHPIDYYQFGLDLIRPLINFKASTLLGLDHIQKMREQISRGENVILLANHQTEPDPQVLSLMLEKIDPSFASQMIFVAGHRVITDPMAIPMSMGRNLLCIYSKKHMTHPPELKAQKMLHNQRTMKKMSELLSQGGQCIYVAPSGGRDRPTAEGKLEVAPFDPQSLEMFWLMTQQAEHPTHFYPLALHTYDLMPPPKHVEKEIGEKRYANHTPVHLAFGPEIDMNHFPGSEGVDKKTKRNKRADYIWNLVKNYYHSFEAPPAPSFFQLSPKKSDSIPACRLSCSAIPL
ncbi:1-acyl-sn-glycerol-3-phosphate acyltransferase [Candidatus Protochlamydia phocaeensis]|uniref:1-acyl-sn-glycerol-3-phosphate acyltransferase n=1 Tax=Candidatus Protochlamydia phocaeensis TaxID=1414722 RepID=UPI0009AEAC67|nr:1-acyl-sn-glycerol-3-phosphate acyltransferase [Candidatus Protochlamydia phocaeensis]